jgi:hypothetical membrane protein
MNFHEIRIYNKPVFYIGAILLFIGTYLDNTNKADNLYVWILLISGLLLMLLGFKKPKESKSNEL